MAETSRLSVMATPDMRPQAHVDLHHFSPGGAISGVSVLAESHIWIHTQHDDNKRLARQIRTSICRLLEGMHSSSGFPRGAAFFAQLHGPYEISLHGSTKRPCG
jgi:hypothetical protein